MMCTLMRPYYGFYYGLITQKGELKVPDKTLVCTDCNEEIEFTEGEQAFYKEKGFF